MAEMSVRACRTCGNCFQKTANNQVHCSIACRFWPKVAVMGRDECWPWLGGHNRHGYGKFSVGLKECNASRMAFELANGHIDTGEIQVCHTCDNPSCCNPGHLFLGTVADNARDCRQKHRSAYGERNANAKLTERDVSWIRRSVSLGRLSQAEAARMFDVSRSAVSDLCAQITWRRAA